MQLPPMLAHIRNLFSKNLWVPALLMASLAAPAASQAAFGQVAGLERIQADIAADAHNNFSHLMFTEWPLTYYGSEAVNLRVNPATAFQVRDGAGQNQFVVTLISSEGLRTPFGAIMPITVDILGRGNGGGTGTDEIGVQFMADQRNPIDLDQLRWNPQVTDFRLEATPGQFVVQTGFAGTQVYYRRARGHGLDPVQVILTFRYSGTPFRYIADLPTRDDGVRQGSFEFSLFHEIKGSDLVRADRSYTGWSANDMRTQFETDLRHTLLDACSAARSDPRGDVERCRKEAIRNGSIRADQILSVQASSEPCSPDHVDYPRLDDSACNFSPMMRGGICSPKWVAPEDMGGYTRELTCTVFYERR